MLNIYDGVLRLVNPKLYYSPYMESVNEVIHVIEEVDKDAKKLLLKNLLTLKFKKNKMDNPIIGSYYENDKNIIYADYTKDSFNHELCHVAGRRYNKLLNINDNGILNYFNEEDSLNEGIVEYLSLLSLRKRVSNSLYQFEVFVVEFLVSIYGVSVLKPYFSASREGFYEQFGMLRNNIEKISLLLNMISSLNRVHTMRLNYLLVSSFNENKSKIDDIRSLKLDFDTYQLIDRYFKENKSDYLELRELKKNGITIYNYPYRDDFKLLYDYMEDEYRNKLLDVSRELLGSY